MIKRPKMVLVGVPIILVIGTFAICNRKSSTEEVVIDNLFSQNPNRILSTVSENERQVSNITSENVMQLRNIFFGNDPKISNVSRNSAGAASNFNFTATCKFRTGNLDRTFVFQCREDAISGKKTIDDWIRILMVHKACIDLKDSSIHTYNVRLAEVAAEVTPKLKALGITGLSIKNGDQVIDNVDDIPKWAFDRIAMEGH